MVKVTPEKESTRRMVEGSIHTFLRGKKNLNWVIGVIRSSGMSKNDLQNLVSAIRKDHVENALFQELENKCRELSFL